jgi:hypothetical protein
VSVDNPCVSVVRPPDPSLIAAADVLDAAIAEYLKDRVRPTGHWEALDDAWVMTNLVVRHVEGVLELARTDEVLIAPAWACARSAMEVAARVRWLLEPTEVHEREARWLARLDEDERYGRAIAALVEAAGGDPARLLQIPNTIRDFRDAVAAQFPGGIAVPKGVPGALSTMVNDEGALFNYRLGSQYVHGTHVGGGLFRRHLGSRKKLGEHVSTKAWTGPLDASWWGLVTAGAASNAAIGGVPWPPEHIVERVQAALRVVRDARG